MSSPGSKETRHKVPRSRAPLGSVSVSRKSFRDNRQIKGQLTELRDKWKSKVL